MSTNFSVAVGFLDVIHTFTFLESLLQYPLRVLHFDFRSAFATANLEHVEARHCDASLTPMRGAGRYENAA
jgi:hypothetical protein